MRGWKRVSNASKVRRSMRGAFGTIRCAETLMLLQEEVPRKEVIEWEVKVP